MAKLNPTGIKYKKLIFLNSDCNIQRWPRTLYPKVF